MVSHLKPTVKPRIIIHGGAGNFSRENLTHEAYLIYQKNLLRVLRDAERRLAEPGATALDVATFAVSQLENNGIFNSGHGAVFTTAGTIELEASVMVSKGYRKRGVGVMRVTRAKNPIKLAREMLIRGEREDGGGAQSHCQLSGETCDRLAEEWGLDLAKPSYFWTRKSWDAHRRGLGKTHDDETYEKHRNEADAAFEGNGVGYGDALQSGDTIDGLDGDEYVAQGTVGTVVLDSTGTLCVATSTGGITNKLPGRVGDTPTIGSGFFAEEWLSTLVIPAQVTRQPPPLESLPSLISDCLPGLSGYLSLPSPPVINTEPKVIQVARGVAMSGTGNGDSFLRIAAVRTAAAIARFSPGVKKGSESSPGSEAFPTLQSAVTAVAGPNGMLQQSAGDRWHKTGEGEGGIIGIEFVDGKGKIVADFNCGGMLRAWIDDDGKERMALFREGEY